MKPGTTGSLDSSDNIYYVIYFLLGTPSYWLSILLVPVTCLLPDVLMQGMERWFQARDHQIIQEWAKGKQSGDIAKLVDKIHKRGPSKSVMIEGTDLLDEVRHRSHTGYAFESPQGTSYYAPQEVVDAQKRASVFVLRKRSNYHGQSIDLGGANKIDEETLPK